MFKQLAAAVMALTLLVSGGAGVLAAEDAPKGMKKATEKLLKDEYYDYKGGSLEPLSNITKVEVTPEEEGEPITVYAGLAEFKTVRDNIFTFDRKETVYYDATNDKMLSATEVGAFQNDTLTNYKEQFEHLGKKMNLGWVMSLHALILLVPAYLMFVWGNQVYSSSRFMVGNNLYGQKHTFN
ncbi:hypothetical protein [Bacillus sp. Marseille-Q3570]|uniref:hypothetical protein n=1 Tax=Bacillus sp. Marseille-Q3570 TaxID=2963522 RepID=UPI0021B81211|nr:hypothetical protein [Bacillus sp. Marseille-Q3570]